MLNVFMLSVWRIYTILSVSFTLMLMLSVFMLNVIMLSVSMLSVVAPFDTGTKSNFLYEETPNKFLCFLGPMLYNFLRS